MTRDEAIKFFGSQAALARAIGCRQPSIFGWGEFPPFERQQQIERLSAGQLKAQGYDEYIAWKTERRQGAVAGARKTPSRLSIPARVKAFLTPGK